MSFHHYVTKSIIKHWQPSFDITLANKDKSNGGVYLHDTFANKTKLETNLQKLFSEEFLNHADVETRISTFIEKHFGNLDSLMPKDGQITSTTPPWRIYRGIVLLLLLQASRIPTGTRPLINEILNQDESQIDSLVNAYTIGKKIIGIKLPNNVHMFLNDIGFFLFPAFDFQNITKVLSAKKTSDLWGIAVPLRPNFCFISLSSEFGDLNWINKNMHIFQTYSVGLNCQRMIVPPRLKDGGEIHSGKTKKEVTIQECILDFQNTFRIMNDHIAKLHEIQKKMESALGISTYK